MPIKPEVGQFLKNCVGTFDFFDPRNPLAKFQRNQFVKSTQLGNFAAEIGVPHPRVSNIVLRGVTGFNFIFFYFPNRFPLFMP